MKNRISKAIYALIICLAFVSIVFLCLFDNTNSAFASTSNEINTVSAEPDKRFLQTRWPIILQ